MLHAADLPLYDNLRMQAEWMGGLIPEPPRAEVDDHVGQGDRVRAGAVSAQVLHTPGHTPGSICFHVEGASRCSCSRATRCSRAASGAPTCGAATSTRRSRPSAPRLLTLDDTTRVIPGHGPETTIGWERRRNPFLNGG